jgi:hypothetical protein
MNQDIIKKQALDYVVNLYNAYEHLADHKKELKISRHLFEQIIEFGKAI